MNAVVAVNLGLAFWMVMCTIIGAIKSKRVPRSIVFTRFVVFLATLGFAAAWWTP